MSHIEDLLRQDIDKTREDNRALFEANVQELEAIAAEYSNLKKNPGWQRLEREILLRLQALAGRLHTEDTPKIYRTQGESLALQSILSTIEDMIIDAKEARKQLEEEHKNG